LVDPPTCFPLLFLFSDVDLLPRERLFGSWSLVFLPLEQSPHSAPPARWYNEDEIARFVSSERFLSRPYRNFDVNDSFSDSFKLLLPFLCRRGVQYRGLQREWADLMRFGHVFPFFPHEGRMRSAATL